jgi:hypothetical protein
MEDHSSFILYYCYLPTTKIKSIGRTTVPIANVININGNPILNHLLKVIGCPSFSAKPAATTPALDPIKVPFPPRSAPNAKAHHNGLK